ncbi:iron ABC transporter permease, partial [bacterium]|nr:iron ABC transporter permease [bacterium]
WLLAIPFIIPSYVFAVAWIDLLGRNGFLTNLLTEHIGMPNAFEGLALYSPAGVILVLSLSFFPIVALTTGLAVRRLDPRLEEASRLADAGKRTLLCITLPLLMPAILTGGLLVFALSLVEFAVPSLLQVHVYTVEVYSRFCAFYSLAGATAQATPLLVIGLGVLAVWAGWVRPRDQRLVRQGEENARESGRLSRLGALVWCVSLVVFSAIMPVAVLFRRSLPLSTYLQTFKTVREEIWTTAWVSAASAGVLVLLAFGLVFVQRKGLLKRGMAILSLAPFLISGPVLGIGLILLWNHAGPASLIYDTPAVMILACSARFFFFAFAAAGLAIHALPKRVEEPARVAGMHWARQLKGLFLPLAWPSLVGAWGFVFLLCVGEIDATILVCPPGRTTLPVRLFTLMHYGPSPMVAALAVITVLLVSGGALVAGIAYNRMKRTMDAFH